MPYQIEWIEDEITNYVEVDGLYPTFEKAGISPYLLLNQLKVVCCATIAVTI